MKADGVFRVKQRDPSAFFLEGGGRAAVGFGARRAGRSGAGACG